MTFTISTTTPGRLDIAEPWGTTLVDEWNLTPARKQTPVPLDITPGWRIPLSKPPKMPRVQERLRQIKEWTGWSSRTLAEATGTTHPTVESILQGRSRLIRSPHLVHRICLLFQLVSRLWIVVDGDRTELTRALSEQPTSGRSSSLAVLGSGQLADAYLAALDVLTPPRVDGMMRGRFASRPGEASVPLDDV